MVRLSFSTVQTVDLIIFISPFLSLEMTVGNAM